MQPSNSLVDARITANEAQKADSSYQNLTMHS